MSVHVHLTLQIKQAYLLLQFKAVM